MFIKNRALLELDSLDKNQLFLREVALNSIEIALNSVKPENLVANNVDIINDKLIIQEDIYDLKLYNNIHVIGGGKASAHMLLSLEKLLEKTSKIEYDGIITVPEGLEIDLSLFSGNILINRASHPLPNDSGLKGTEKMMEIVKNASEKDLIICLISGGGSALLPLPKKGVLLNELKSINSLLLASGASIEEINAVRKHLSDFKGGNLAKYVYNTCNATLIALIISDVVGDKLDTISSGPTVPDPTSFSLACEIIDRYGLLDKIPNSTRIILENGLKDISLENPKLDDEYFSRVHNYLIGSVKDAVKSVKAHLKSLNFTNTYFSDSIIGEASEFGEKLYEIIIQKKEELSHLEKIALIGTGELTVNIKGDGIGGRNQEMLLSFLSSILNKKLDEKILVIAANLDGIEGNSEAMGALVDNEIIKQIILKNLEPRKFLNNNDSNTFFKLMGTDIISGFTGCNVNDIILILISH